jgi:hypothetical protein
VSAPDDRGTGRTTRLIEQAVDLAAEADVFVVGAHPNWVRELAAEFRASGLVGVEFLTVDQVRDGKLRGRRGHLLVDDFDDLPQKDRDLLVHTGRWLRVK